MDWKPEVRIWMALGEILEAGERCGACGWHAPYCTNKACLPCAPDPCEGIGNERSILRRESERENDDGCRKLFYFSPRGRRIERPIEAKLR